MTKGLPALMATALKSLSTEYPKTLKDLVKTFQEITGWLVFLSLLLISSCLYWYSIYHYDLIFRPFNKTGCLKQIWEVRNWWK